MPYRSIELYNLLIVNPFQGILTRIEYWFSGTFFITSFKKDTFKKLFEKKGTMAENFGRADDSPPRHACFAVLDSLLIKLQGWKLATFLKREDSNAGVADKISTKLLSSFCECEVLFGVPGWHDFEFSINVVERKRGKTQLIYRKLKLLITTRFESHFKVT